MTIKLIKAAASGTPSGTIGSGEVELDFGAAPGTDMVAAAIVRASVTAATIVAAFIEPKATANKSIDEHLIDSIEAYAHSVVAGVGFTVTARSTAGLLMGIYNVGWFASE